MTFLPVILYIDVMNYNKLLVCSQDTVGETGASCYRGKSLQRPLAPALFIDLITKCQHNEYHDLLSVH